METIRFLTPSDARAVSKLINYNRIGVFESALSVHDILSEWEYGKLDYQTETWGALVKDKLIVSAWIHIDKNKLYCSTDKVYHYARIFVSQDALMHYEHLAYCIVDKIVQRAERQACAVSASHYVNILLNNEEGSMCGLLQSYGFVIAPCVHHMRNNNLAQLPIPSSIDGIRIGAYSIDDSDIYSAITDAFGFMEHEEYYEFCNKKNGTWRLAINNHSLAVVGCCLVTINRYQNAASNCRDSHIHVLGVCNAHQGIGIGSALLLDALRHIRNSGVNAATITVHSNNEPAKHLYSKLGFQIVHTEMSGEYAIS